MMTMPMEAPARLMVERLMPMVVLAKEREAPTGPDALRLLLEARLGLWPVARLSLLYPVPLSVLVTQLYCRIAPNRRAALYTVSVHVLQTVYAGGKRVGGEQLSAVTGMHT